MNKLVAAALATSLATGCATSPPVSDAARSELAPTGTLRAGMNLGNALFTKKDAASGELRGVSVDLMRELASRLGVPVEFVVHATPGEVADAADKGTWDVAILAIEQAFQGLGGIKIKVINPDQQETSVVFSKLQ